MARAKNGTNDMKVLAKKYRIRYALSTFSAGWVGLGWVG